MSSVLTSLPTDLRRRVADIMNRYFACLCISVDEGGCLLDSVGDAAALGIDLPNAGEALADALPWIVGLDLAEARLIPEVTVSGGRALDLHVVPGAPAWLVLVDRGDVVDARRRTQQAANEARLVNAEQRRLMDKLIDSRAELALRQQEAEESNRRKTEFIAGMAHEFRTPLTSILGYTQLLGEQLQAHGAGDAYLASVERAARHLLSLVENNLDQARLEAGSLRIHHSDADPRQLVDDLSAIIAPLAAEKSLSFAAYVSRAVPATLWLDEVRFRQVLVNLLSNAVKFTDEGEVKLLLDWDGGWLECKVMDTGPGIPEQARARIFEAFQRLEDTAIKPGAGLGLNISMRLVKLMGGEIVLASTPGAGSEFTVRLPARPGRERSRSGKLEGTGEFLRRRSGNQPIPVLLAEDNPDIMELLALFLSQSGYEPVKAEDGERAVALALERAPPLAILDINMPGLDGLAALNRLRSQGYRGRVIALTATRGAEHRQAALDAGFDEFLSKPVQMPLLLNTMERLLER